MAESAAALEKSDHEADEAADEKAQHWPVHGPRISAADIGYALLPGSVPVLSPGSIRAMWGYGGLVPSRQRIDGFLAISEA